MRRNALVLSLFALILTACVSAGAGYEPPQPEAPAAFVAYGAPVEAGGEPVSWWGRFQDPALDALIEQALESNLELREAVQRVEASRALRAGARQEWLPRGGATASREERRLSSFETGGAPARIDAASAGVSASWEIDLFGRVRSLNRAAAARLGGSEAIAEQVRIVIAADVARTWFSLRALEARERMLERYRDQQRELVAILEARFEEGFTGEADLERARLLLAEDVAALAATRHAIRVERHALAVLVGEMPGSWQPPILADQAPLALEPVALESPLELIRRRPDVVAAERRLAAATAEIGVAAADYFPQLRLDGFLGFLAGSSEDLGSSGSRSWFGGPTLTWGIFDLGRVRARVRAADATADAALAAWEQTVLTAVREIEDSLSGLAAAQEALAATDDQVRHARRATELVELRYEEGESGYYEVLEARRSAIRAEMARIDAVASHRGAMAELLRAAGTRPSFQRAGEL